MCKADCRTCWECCELYTDFDWEDGYQWEMCLCQLHGEVEIEDVKENGCTEYNYEPDCCGWPE